MKLPLFIGCGQSCVLSNQIVGFFDNQYLWKESSDLSFFLHGNHQLKVGPETTIFWLVVACCISDQIRLKDSLISNKTEKNQLISLFFLHGDNHQGKVAFSTTTLD